MACQSMDLVSSSSFIVFFSQFLKELLQSSALGFSFSQLCHQAQGSSNVIAPHGRLYHGGIEYLSLGPTTSHLDQVMSDGDHNL